MNRGMLKIEAARGLIEDLCRTFGVRKLWVFGSAAKGDWNPESSDFDLAAEFGPPPEGLSPLRQFFGFQKEMETVLESKVDIVEWSGAKNPIFRRIVERTRKEIYAG